MNIHRMCAYTVLGSMSMNHFRANPPEIPRIGLRPHPPPPSTPHPPANNHYRCCTLMLY